MKGNYYAFMKDNKLNIKLGEIIRNQRKTKKLTMKELGEKVGVTEGAIHLYEAGKRGMTVSMFFNVCNILGLDANEVMKEVNGEN